MAPEEFERDLGRAYRKVAGQVRIPGFRRGKAPRQIIDSMVGREVVLEEFVHDSLPDYYARAVREHDLTPIGQPEIDLDEVHDGTPLKFTATVEVRPRLELELDQYKGVEVQAPPEEPAESEVTEYVDRLRERFAELEVATRPAGPDDYVLADVRAHVHDREIAEATRVGFLTRVGSEDLLPELDEELKGKRAGDILKFNATLPASFGETLSGTEVAFQVLVKEVKAKKLPPADDEFAKTASEFDTLEALRADVRGKLAEYKSTQARAAVRDLVLRKVVDSVTVDLPESMVDEETDRRVASAKARLDRSGVSLDQALEAQGWDELQFRADSRAHAVRALKADLVLEAVAAAEGIEASPEDVDGEVAALAAATGRPPKEVRRMVERSGQVSSLTGDIIRSKALDLMVESANVISGDASAEQSAPPTDEATSSETEVSEDEQRDE